MSKLVYAFPPTNIEVMEFFILTNYLIQLQIKTFKDFDIVISDHSKDDVIWNGVKIVTMILILHILKIQMDEAV